MFLQTHNVALASPVAEFVVSMGSDGRVASQGSLSKILAKDSELSAQITEESQKILNVEEEIDEADQNDSADKNHEGKLIVEEEIAVGHIGWPARSSHDLSVPLMYSDRHTTDPSETLRICFRRRTTVPLLDNIRRDALVGRLSRYPSNVVPRLLGTAI